MFIFITRNTRVILEEESGTELTTVENENKPHYVKEEFGKFNIHSCLLKKLFESLIIILVTLITLINIIVQMTNQETLFMLLRKKQRKKKS